MNDPKMRDYQDTMDGLLDDDFDDNYFEIDSEHWYEDMVNDDYYLTTEDGYVEETEDN